MPTFPASVIAAAAAIGVDVTTLGEQEVELLKQILATSVAIAGGGGGGGITALTGDGTATGPGSSVLTVTKSNGVPFGTGAFASTVVPGGSSGQVQLNISGAFAGDAALAWNSTNKNLTIGNGTNAFQGVYNSGGSIVAASGNFFGNWAYRYANGMMDISASGVTISTGTSPALTINSSNNLQTIKFGHDSTNGIILVSTGTVCISNLTSNGIVVTSGGNGALSVNTTAQLLTDDTGWTANADGGDKTVAIPANATLNTIATALNALVAGAGDALANTAKKCKALETALVANLLPNA